ncbi:MAG TPA: ComF family protein [Thermoleophilaceae bacterium]|nr:ComF family protein [Thermoleophilaceae bacterium]
MALLTRALELVVPPFCWECGGSAASGEPLCRECRTALRWLGEKQAELAGVRLWAAVAYEGPARALVGGLKYRGAPGLARPMAAQMVAGAPAGLLECPAALVPVPLHPARRRRRGYNQAERLAAALSRRTGLPVAEVLRRHGPAARQVGQGRQERLVGIEGSVAVRPRAAVPSRVLLVDDVATTGATLSACAAALREAGPCSVRAVTYARTPGR